MAGERTALVRQVEETGAALAKLAQSLSAYDGETRILGRGSILVMPYETISLKSDDERLDLELPRLRRMLENVSRHSHRIYEYLTEFNDDGLSDRERRRLRANGMRLAATIRDCMTETVTLLNGESLDPGIYGGREFDVLEGVIGSADDAVVRDQDPLRGHEELAAPINPKPMPRSDEVAYLTPPELEERDKPLLTAEAYQLREAEIYKRIKDFQMKVNNGDTFSTSELQEILDYIKD